MALYENLFREKLPRWIMQVNVTTWKLHFALCFLENQPPRNANIFLLQDKRKSSVQLVLAFCLFLWITCNFFVLIVKLNVQENNRFRSNRHSRVEMCPMAPCAICGYPRDRGTAHGLFFSHDNFVYLLLSCCYLSHTHIPSHKVNVPILQP